MKNLQNTLSAMEMEYMMWPFMLMMQQAYSLRQSAEELSQSKNQRNSRMRMVQ